MPRYIDADEALLELDKELVSDEFNYAVRAISRVKTADVVERKKGRWIKNDFYEDALMCSRCRAYIDKEDWSRHYFYFCFHCGAFMEGMDTEEEKTDAEIH